MTAVERIRRRRAPRATRVGTTSVTAAVARFAVTGMAALALLAFAGIELLGHIGTSEAIRNSRELTRLAGRGVIAPYLTTGLLAGKPLALREVDAAVRKRLLFDPVIRVKIWTAHGRIVYSDEHRLIGSTYPLGDDELAALRRGGIQAEVSDLTRPENRFERKYSKLLEVYLGLRATDGTPVLFEVYQRFSSIAASGQRLWRTFLPPMIGTMILLELVQIPFALSLARKLRRGQEDREALLQRALDASELERRRIARDLHDGPVQDLAGVSYTTTAASQRLQSGETDGLAKTLDDVARQTRRSIRALRTLLVDIYPPRLHSEGLAAALSDLVAPMVTHGLDVQLEVDPQLRLPDQTEAVLFRAAQESIRNIVEHADAARVRVSVSSPGGQAVLEVQDDGCGFSVPDAAREGHFGLRMLEDLARDGHGVLKLESRPGAGTRVQLGVPLR